MRVRSAHAGTIHRLGGGHVHAGSAGELGPSITAAPAFSHHRPQVLYLCIWTTGYVSTIAGYADWVYTADDPGADHHARPHKPLPEQAAPEIRVCRQAAAVGLA